MTDQTAWRLGQTSERFESGGAGPGAVSGGQGDLGGISYGSYQLASGPGTVGNFVRQSTYKTNFADMAVNSNEFIAEWKQLASSDPGFGVAQHDFIQKTHYEPRVKALQSIGFDPESRGPAVQDMVWSTAVQYQGLTSKVVPRGLEEAYGKDYKLDDLSDAQIVTAVQDSKLRHVLEDFRSSKANSPGLEKRIETEKHALVYLADNGVPMPSREVDAIERSFAPLRVGSSGDRVQSVQRDLKDLGYLSRAGGLIDADGHFGPATRDGLVQFQAASGLYPHGEITVLTRLRLDEQKVARDIGMASLAEQRDAAPVCRLDDPSHPDSGLYRSTRLLVHDLDRQHGRQPDSRSDNLAASLVVAARQGGLERVDQVALSDDASRLWGIQRPPGVRDHFFDRLASTDTVHGLNTPIAESSNRWPEAMQAYESLRQSEQQTLQQTQEQQSQSQSGPSMSHSR